MVESLRAIVKAYVSSCISVYATDATSHSAGVRCVFSGSGSGWLARRSHRHEGLLYTSMGQADPQSVVVRIVRRCGLSSATPLLRYPQRVGLLRYGPKPALMRPATLTFDGFKRGPGTMCICGQTAAQTVTAQFRNKIQAGLVGDRFQNHIHTGWIQRIQLEFAPAGNPPKDWALLDGGYSSQCRNAITGHKASSP